MIPRDVIIAAVAVLTVILTGFVILSVRGVGTADYALFLGGPVVSAVVGVILAQRTARVAAVVEQVKHQTNSLLTGELGALSDKLDAAQLDRADKAAPGWQPQTPTRIDTKLPPDVA